MLTLRFVEFDPERSIRLRRTTDIPVLLNVKVVWYRFPHEAALARRGVPC
jgi:hypothetical protein